MWWTMPASPYWYMYSHSCFPLTGRGLKGSLHEIAGKKKGQKSDSVTYMQLWARDGMLIISHTSYVVHLQPSKYKLWACGGHLNISYQSWDKYPHAKPLPQADNILKPRPRSPARSPPLWVWQGTRTCFGVYFHISWSTNSNLREKGLVPSTGGKKAAWGARDLSAVVSSARKRKTGHFHVPASLGRKKG